MAFTFPLDAATFFGGLKIAEMSLFPDQPRKITQTRGGAAMDASLGEPLWRGSVSLVVRTHQDQAAIEAMLDVAARPGATFLAHDTRLNGPAADPGGVTLGAATPAISTVSVDRFDVTVSGLPVGYVLTAGDQLGVSYSGGKRGLHRIAIGDTADGSGLATVTVSTPVASGVVALDAVTLVRPVIKAVLTGVSYGGARPKITAGSSFQFVQSLG